MAGTVTLWCTCLLSIDLTNEALLLARLVRGIIRISRPEPRSEVSSLRPQHDIYIAMAAIQIYLHQINSFPYFNLDVIRPPQSLLDMDHFVHGICIYITLLYILHHFLEGSLFSDIISC